MLVLKGGGGVEWLGVEFRDWLAFLGWVGFDGWMGMNSGWMDGDGLGEG